MITSNTAATGRRPRVLCVDDDGFMLSILSKKVTASSAATDCLDIPIKAIATAPNPNAQPIMIVARP